MADIKDIHLNEDMVSILKDCGLPQTEATIRSKFGCTAVIRGVEVDSGPSPKQPSVGPEKRYSIQLSTGMTVSVWKDDLTTHRIDAVVNAANKRLSHGAGLARALCDAGGPEIQRESQRHIDTRGKLSTGDAVITKAGNLPCQIVIHAVGPELSHQPTSQALMQATRLLERAVENILGKVREARVQSVAIPALSSGIFNFPLPLCADTIVTTLKNYRPHPQSKPLEVRLVNNDEKSVAEMTRACTSILGSGSAGSYSRAVQSPGRGQVKGQSPSFTPGPAKPSLSTVQIGNVTLTLKMGNIEKEKADVIVNTTSPELNLSMGEISKAILKKAGRQMQDDINQRYGRTGDVLVTKGYNLDCRVVYHTLCAGRNETSAIQILQRVISDCLSKASTYGTQSISFPAIGTGSLGFQKREVAEIMTRAVFEFAKNFQGKMHINFVIYPTDTETLKAFEVSLMSLQSPASSSHSSTASSHHSSTQGFVQTNNHHQSRPEMPQIKLSSAFDERNQEAEQWIYDVLCPVVSDFQCVQNNFIQHLGQLEHNELQFLQTEWNVSITEGFVDGCASIMITGGRRGVIAARLGVEAMCCKVQEEFAKDEECTLALMTNSNVSGHQRKPCEPGTERSRNFAGFNIVRVEKVENPSLKQMFELKKKQLSAKPQQLYQRVPAQFCDLVSRVGFQREYSPPADQKYGAGIYFSGSVTGAEKLWKNLASDKFLYFVEAQVLTGRSTHGSRDLIVPPCLGGDPLILYDSVNGGVDTHVIFNGHQALPEYLITCRKDA